MKNVLERYVVKDWKLKLLSLGLAVMLWYTVFQIGEPKKDITVPVTISNVPKGMVIMKRDPERVFVTVSGRVSLLKEIKDGDVSAVINMNGTNEGENVFNFSKSNVIVPKGIEIVDVRPGTVSIFVDRIVEKKLEVVAVLDKKLIGRYNVVHESPAFVTAEGPRKVLDKVGTVETVPLGGDLRRSEEIVNASFKLEDLPRVRVRPETARITLKRQNPKDTYIYP